jgi:putative alpha-1,2-mannosidase
VDEDFTRFVNPLVGTKSMGHTYPGATVPFGMVRLSPDIERPPMYDESGAYNREVYRYCSGYQYGDSTIFGFSHTHFSGTGHSNLGNISLRVEEDRTVTGYRQTTGWAHTRTVYFAIAALIT